MTRQLEQPVPRRTSANPVNEAIKLLESKDDWQMRQHGLSQIRELAATAAPQWLSGQLERCVPLLLMLLKELRSALFGDVCATFSALVSALALEHDFLRVLPKIADGMLNTPTREKIIYDAGNRVLRTIVASTTHSQFMGLAEEACKNSNNFRMRSRGFDCLLQMLLMLKML